MKDPYDEDDNRDSGDNKGRGPNGQPPMKMNRGMFGWLVLIGLVIALFVVLSQAQNQAEEKSVAELLSMLKSGHISKVLIEDMQITAELNENAPNAKTDKIVVPVSHEMKLYAVPQIMRYKDTPNLTISDNPGSSALVTMLIGILPWLLFFALIWFFFIRGLRNAGGGGGMLGNFGRSKHRLISKEMTDVSLNDVAGVEEAKEEVEEIIQFLKNPKKFQRLGGRIPRGVLLVGQPGCGKTLLAKAVAGEAEVPFFSISGSDFVEMFVGVGASRVRDLFKQAKDNSPCIIFLDEIDAVGRRRGTGFNSGGHDEREQTLNAILVEMDGFETNDQVIVVAATNRSDVLDPALTRPGRFDRQIQVHLPDVKGRLQILSVHAKKVKMSPMVDLEKTARGTPMFSGADLAAIINEAAIIATLANKDFVEQDDLEEARDKVKFGRAFKSRKFEQEERVATAYHEAGHAILQHLLPDADPLHKVTIMPRGHFLGASFQLPEKDRYGMNRKYVEAQMRVACGGRIAEHRKTEDTTSGAQQDIRQVTAFARHMILEWGMSEKLGFIDYQTPEYAETMMPERPYSDETARVIDLEVRRLVDEAYADADHKLNENWDKVVAIAEALLQYETLTADEVDQLMKGERLDKPSISDILDNEADKGQTSTNLESKPKRDEPDDFGTDSIPSPA